MQTKSPNVPMIMHMVVLASSISSSVSPLILDMTQKPARIRARKACVRTARIPQMSKAIPMRLMAIGFIVRQVWGT